MRCDLALLVAAVAMSFAAACARDHRASAGSERADAGAVPDAGARLDGASRSDGPAPMGEGGGESSTADASLASSAIDEARHFLDACYGGLCARHVRCEPPEAPASSQAICHPEVQRQHARSLLESLARGVVRFDPDEAATVMAELEPGGACARAWYVLPPDCARAFRGTLSPGEACHRETSWPHGGDPCMSGSRCIADATCPGRCQSFRAAGEPCSHGTECARSEPLVCVEGRCQGPGDGGPGEACTYDFQCSPELRCADGACTAPTFVGEGASCEGESVACVEPLLCLPDADYHWSCVDPSRSGSPCSRVGPTSTCTGNLLCAGAGEDGIGTCTAGLPVGEVCTTRTVCERGARCVDGRCRRVVGPGEACDLDRVCPRSHYCTDGRCQPLPRAGESCARSASCIEGRCMDGTCVLLPDDEGCRGERDVPLGECEGHCNGPALGWCEPTKDVDASCQGDAECGEGLECRFGWQDLEGRCLPVCD